MYDVKAAVAISDGDRIILPGTPGSISQGAMIGGDGKIAVSWAWGITAGGTMQGVSAEAYPEQLVAV